MANRVITKPKESGLKPSNGVKESPTEQSEEQR